MILFSCWTRQVLLTDFKRPILLDTLATAYAAAELFDQAVTAAEKALFLAISEKNDKLANHASKQLEIYRKASLSKKK